MKKRLITFLICIMLMLSSCSDDILDPIITNTPDSYPTEELTEAASSVSLAGYKIIRPSSASDSVIAAAVNLRRTLSEVKENISISDDWVKSVDDLPTEALEILVGETNRPESGEVFAELLADDYAVKYFPESGRIVICGGNDAATLKAIEYFIEFCLTDGEIGSTLSFFSAGQYAVTECLLCGEPIENYTLVIPKNADADEKYAAELITNRIREKTGKGLNTVSDSQSPSEKLILIGKTEKTPDEFASLNGSEAGYVLGMSGDSIVLGGDGGLVVKAARELLEMLFPKGEEKVSLSLENAKIIPFSKASYPALENFGTKPIALADQLNASIAVYDLAAGEPILKYEFKPQTSKGFSLNGYGNRVDEARLRYSEKWGTYIICFTSSSGYVGIAGYPSEECLWEVELKGTSPHSIEYLPNGTVAVASSGGSDTNNGFVRLYSTEKGKSGNIYAEAQLTSSHAVLWDETREILWAMGSTNIVAYEVGDDPANPTLTKISAYGCSDMKGGHDLSAISGNDDQLWVGGSFVRVFDKTTGKLLSNYDGANQISTSSVKCICSFPDGDAALTVATGVYADHNTDRFKLFKIEGTVATPTVFTFDGRAFYKARAFIANYN